MKAAGPVLEAGQRQAGDRRGEGRKKGEGKKQTFWESCLKQRPFTGKNDGLK